jgi:hypothetical protein
MTADWSQFLLSFPSFDGQLSDQHSSVDSLDASHPHFEALG